jgi:dienelactone hydrolase
MAKSMVGQYGSWALSFFQNREKSFSFLNSRWSSIDQWRKESRKLFLDHLGPSPMVPLPNRPQQTLNVNKSYQEDDLIIEELSWQLPYGPETKAVFLKPANHNGRLPGILALHDHGGNKYFGKRKISRTSGPIHPLMEQHQNEYYEGRAWANELARRGYGVLVHDVFPFASRRVKASDIPGEALKASLPSLPAAPGAAALDNGNEDLGEWLDVSPAEREDEIHRYNMFASAHEHLTAKSLFSAGLTWPGVFVGEDRFALSVLAAREDIDETHLGCGGLSGGGLRTNYLSAADQRITCSVTVGFMSTFSDFLFNKCYTHTWMLYIPHLPRFMDFPDILCIICPTPALVLSTKEDPLYTADETIAACTHIQEVYDKAEASERFSWSMHSGPHFYNAEMQKEAFAWFDRWLKR